MSDREPPAGKKGFASRLAYFTPFYAIRRAGEAVGATKESLASTLADIKNSLPTRDPNHVYPENDARSIDDPGERFRVMYEMHGWTDEELAKQKTACARTKLVGLIGAIFSFFTVIALLFVAPVWMLLFLLPIGGCLCILCLAQSFKFALYQAQLDLRTLISARDFFGRDDFLARMVD